MTFTKRDRKNVGLGILGIAISIVACIVLYYKIDFEAVLAAILQISPLSFWSIGGLYLLTPLFRTLRWRRILPNQRNYLNSIVLGFAGNNVLPMRGGELVRMEYFHRVNPKTKRLTVIASIASAKLLDGLCLLCLLLVVVFMGDLWNRPWVGSLLKSVIPALGILLLLILILRFTSIHNQEKSAEWLQRFQKFLAEFKKGVQFLAFDFNTFLIILYTLCIWIAEATMFYICLYAFDTNSSLLIPSMFALVIVNFGIAIPSSPGYIGVFQAMTIFALHTVFGISKEIAAAIGIIVNFFQLLPITIWGLLILLRLNWRRR